jgi:capsid protein
MTLQEALDDLYDRWVDPREPWDDDGGDWQPLGAAGDGPGGGVPFTNEEEHRRIRSACRRLAVLNEFAVNGHENRISYIVGTGHTYRAVLKKESTAPEPLAREVQELLDRVLRENRWHARQQELVRRRDRDGEAFLRFFDGPDGILRVRFIEPGQVSGAQRPDDPAASFGIVTHPDDVETVEGYLIDGSLVPAEEIQHRKANVDFNVKRGLPLFYPVRKNLARAERLLRNMSVVSEIQSAIALIRRHSQGTRASVGAFVSSQADSRTVRPGSTRGTVTQRIAPGTILDAPTGVEYDFPAAGVDAGKYVVVLQAELRAIASRLVMPEFMLTSDASNANYASTLVAEGPAIKMFQRLQKDQVEDDLVVLRRAVATAVRFGRLPDAALTEIDLLAATPSLAVRDELAEARVSRIEFESGILSPQTWSQRRGLDYDQEQANRARHGPPALPENPE